MRQTQLTEPGDELTRELEDAWFMYARVSRGRLVHVR